MNRLAIAVGIIASLVQLAGYWMYNKKLAHAEINPNATSWAIWGLGDFVALLLYRDLANDWVKELLPFVCTFAAFATFVHMAVRGKFLRPDRLDIEMLLLDVVVVAFWIDSRNAITSNIMLEIDILISFIPILRSTWKNPRTESPKPWLVWTVAYTLLTIVVLMRWEKWWDLLLPLVYLVLHALVWGFAKYRTAES